MGKQCSLPRAFVSYSHKDSKFVDKLIIDLVKADIEIWIDRWEIKVGDSIIEKIETGIKDNDYLIVVLSPNSVSSDWVKRELNSALVKKLNERNIKILPVLIEECVVPLLINDIQRADFIKDYGEALLELLNAFTDHPSPHFTQSFSIAETPSPELIRMNNKVADMILESYNINNKTRKLKLLDETESFLGKILSIHPIFGQARLNLGTIQYEKALALNNREMFQKSIKIFTQALKTLNHFSQTSICYYSIGRAYARLGNVSESTEERPKLYEEAVHYLKKAIKEDKKTHFAYTWLARVYHEMYKITQQKSDYCKAKDYYTEAVTLNPGYLESLGEMKELNQIHGKLTERSRVGNRLWNFLFSKIKSTAESSKESCVDDEARTRLMNYLLNRRDKPI